MTHDEKRIYWQQHIDTWRGGNLSQKAYCQAHQLSLPTFGYWRKRLAVAAPPSKLVPVYAANNSAAVKLHLPGGICLEAAAEAMADLLPGIYRMLQGNV